MEEISSQQYFQTDFFSKKRQTAQGVSPEMPMKFVIIGPEFISGWDSYQHYFCRRKRRYQRRKEFVWILYMLNDIQ